VDLIDNLPAVGQCSNDSKRIRIVVVLGSLLFHASA